MQSDPYKVCLNILTPHFMAIHWFVVLALLTTEGYQASYLCIYNLFGLSEDLTVFFREIKYKNKDLNILVCSHACFLLMRRALELGQCFFAL